MNRCAVVATHHKTGTAWMASTFRSICDELDIRFIHMAQEKLTGPQEIQSPVVIFSPHSDFEITAPWIFENPEYRLFHLIRDPRDVIISAMHYHRVAKEGWLHKPRKKFDGLTYQQKINSLPNDRQRYLFEMNYNSKRVTNAMRHWNYKMPASMECKYEDLMADTNASLFTKIVTHLGFSDGEIEICRKQFLHSSIFGGKAEQKGKTAHIRSGAPRQWRTVFDHDLATAFIERFGDVLVKLGYESNNTWRENLGHLE